MGDGRRIAAGRNPDVGFLHCGDDGLTVNIATHTRLEQGTEEVALRAALDELARRAPLLVSRLRWRRRWLPGPPHDWVLPELALGIPLEVVSPGRGSIQRACSAGANRPLDPTREPPLRAQLLRGGSGGGDGGEDDALLLIAHHALVDGASCGFLFFAIKVLYAAARAGRDLTEVALPRIESPGAGRLVAEGLADGGRLPGIAARGRATLRAWTLLAKQMRVPPGPSGGGFGAAARSRHATVFLDLRDERGAGLRRLMEREDATLHETLLAATSRAVRSWGREHGSIGDALPTATTFNLRSPATDRYGLGNLETALVFATRSQDVHDRRAWLRALVARSRVWKAGRDPWCNFLALTQLICVTPRPLLPRVVDGVARRATLLFSYLGTDFATRYLTHYGAEDPRAVKLVREHAGDGVGYVTSAPPMGVVVTVKRVRQRVALNLSAHDRLADEGAWEELIAAIDAELDAYAALRLEGARS